MNTYLNTAFAHKRSKQIIDAFIKQIERHTGLLTGLLVQQRILAFYDQPFWLKNGKDTIESESEHWKTFLMDRNIPVDSCKSFEVTITLEPNNESAELHDVVVGYVKNSINAWANPETEGLCSWTCLNEAECISISSSCVWLKNYATRLAILPRSLSFGDTFKLYFDFEQKLCKFIWNDWVLLHSQPISSDTKIIIPAVSMYLEGSQCRISHHKYTS